MRHRLQVLKNDPMHYFPCHTVLLSKRCNVGARILRLEYKIKLVLYYKLHSM